MNRSPNPEAVQSSSALLPTFFSVALLMYCACSPSGGLDVRHVGERLSSIVDGREADRDEISATVVLIEDGYGPVCTGTLIAPRVVVTAAHCLQFGGETIPPADLKIGADILDAMDVDSDDLYDVVATIPHPEFTEWGLETDDPDGLSDERDIGILLLAQAVSSVDPVPVLPYSEVDAYLEEGQDLVISGWGMTSMDDTEPPPLQIAETPFQRRTAAELLAGGLGSPDSCFGDSGGPAYLDVGGTRYLVGATSRAPSSSTLAFCGDGGIYTLVSAFDDWIEANSEGLYDGSGEGADLPPGHPLAGPSGDGSCAGQCGGPGSDGYCYCNADCLAYGDCCQDFEAECPDEASGGIPGPDGWLCPGEYFGDGYCDCGCGITDSDCANGNPESCDFVACEGGATVDGDTTACPGDGPAEGDGDGDGENDDEGDGDGDVDDAGLSDDDVDDEDDGDSPGDDDGDDGTDDGSAGDGDGDEVDLTPDLVDDDDDAADTSIGCAQSGEAESLLGLALLAGLVLRRRRRP